MTQTASSFASTQHKNSVNHFAFPFEEMHKHTYPHTPAFSHFLFDLPFLR